MKRKIQVIFTIISLSAILLSGCKSAKEYARFAKAGTIYYAAMDNLLVATSNISTNANSERLLNIDETTNVTSTIYTRTTDNDKARLKVINDLRKHTRLMSRYYDLLFQLASSDAPQQTNEAIGGVVNNLNALGTTLRGSNFFDSSLAGNISGAIVTGIIRGKLRDEIKQRKPFILRELDTQKVLLKKLSAMITQNLTDGNTLREQRRVISKIEDPTALKAAEKEQWIADRLNAVNASNVLTEIEVATDTIEKFEEAFEALDSNKLTLERIDSLLTDLETFLSITESLKEIK